MSGLSKTQAHFGGIKVHNLGKSVLNMSSDGKYSLKSQDGSETMASDDRELINFGKRYARS